MTIARWVPGLATLVELDPALDQRGIRLAFGHLRDRVRRDIERGLPPLPEGGEVSFPNVAAAADAVGRRRALRWRERHHGAAPTNDAAACC